MHLNLYRLKLVYHTQVAETLGDKVKVLKIDVDENPDLSSQLKVRRLPSLPCIIYMNILTVQNKLYTC